MRGCIAGIAGIAGFAIVIACSVDDRGEYGGAGASCEFGGTLTDCPNAPRTVREACWRLVDCGVIPLHDEREPNEFDWDRCVTALDDEPDDRKRVILACIASSTCDELRTGLCLGFGDF